MIPWENLPQSEKDKFLKEVEKAREQAYINQIADWDYQKWHEDQVKNV